ncbi:MAG: hypothetical protein K9J42_02075 [Sulfuritalea sp.]|nr:hypothetical protein [Sulfuritalea sp.]
MIVLFIAAMMVTMNIIFYQSPYYQHRLFAASTKKAPNLARLLGKSSRHASCKKSEQPGGIQGRLWKTLA